MTLPEVNISKQKWIYLIAAVAVVILIVEAVWAYTVFYRPNQGVASIQQLTAMPAPAAPGATIALFTAGSVSVGQMFPVEINVSSSQMTDGTDLIITYDPKMLEVLPLSGQAADQPVFTSGMYKEYPVNSVDATKGIVMLSGISSEANGVLADGNLGTISFTALAKGTTQISIQYQPGKTNESNVIETGTGKDVLISVKNLEVEIK